MCLRSEVLLVGVLPVEFLLPVVLLALKGEKVLAESLHLEEKGKIPPEWEIPEEEEEELLLSDPLPVLWYLWYPFSFAGWTGGHRHLCFWSLPMRWSADTERKARKYKFDKHKNKIGMKIEGIP